jgi:hypothetical protein
LPERAARKGAREWGERLAAPAAAALVASPAPEGSRGLVAAVVVVPAAQPGAGAADRQERAARRVRPAALLTVGPATPPTVRRMAPVTADRAAALEPPALRGPVAPAAPVEASAARRTI